MITKGEKLGEEDAMDLRGVEVKKKKGDSS